MGVNIFAPVKMQAGDRKLTEADADAMVEFANAHSKGKFDWCDKFAGPGGWLLNLEDALNFTEEEAPWWVLTKGKLIEVKGREHWSKLLINSGGNQVIFLKARL